MGTYTKAYNFISLSNSIKRYESSGDTNQFKNLFKFKNAVFRTHYYSIEMNFQWRTNKLGIKKIYIPWIKLSLGEKNITPVANRLTSTCVNNISCNQKRTLEMFPQKLKRTSQYQLCENYSFPSCINREVIVNYRERLENFVFFDFT